MKEIKPIIYSRCEHGILFQVTTLIIEPDGTLFFECRDCEHSEDYHCTNFFCLKLKLKVEQENKKSNKKRGENHE
jgi:hypothetical protein